MKETWKDIKDFEGLYQVSNLGRVRSLTKTVTTKNNKTMHFEGKILKPLKVGEYFSVNLYKDRILYGRRIHRLVAEAFIPNPDNLLQINHKDENKLNNSVDNLEWCSAKYNCNYGSHNYKLSKSKQKPVICYSKKLQLIKKYPSSIAAATELGCTKTSICQCLKGKHKTSCGYIWKFAN